MAEQRGLFGKPVKGRKQKIPSPIILSLTNSDEPRFSIKYIIYSQIQVKINHKWFFFFLYIYRVMLKFEQMHVLVPTHSFLQHCTNQTLWCPCFGKAYNKTPMATRWWRISVRYVIRALRKPFFVWTKVKMVRFGKRINRTPLHLKRITTTFKPQKHKMDLFKKLNVCV